MQTTNCSVSFPAYDLVRRQVCCRCHELTEESLTSGRYSHNPPPLWNTANCIVWSHNPFSYWVAELLKGILALTPSLSAHRQSLSRVYLLELFVKHSSQGLSRSPFSSGPDSGRTVVSTAGVEKCGVTCLLPSPYTFFRSCEQGWGSAKRRRASLGSGTTMPYLTAMLFSRVVSLWSSLEQGTRHCLMRWVFIVPWNWSVCPIQTDITFNNRHLVSHNSEGWMFKRKYWQLWLLLLSEQHTSVSLWPNSSCLKNSKAIGLRSTIMASFELDYLFKRAYLQMLLYYEALKLDHQHLNLRRNSIVHILYMYHPGNIRCVLWG